MIFLMYIQALKTLSEALLALISETRVAALKGRQSNQDDFGAGMLRLQSFLPMLNDYIRRAQIIGPDLILLLDFLEGRIVRPDVNPSAWAERMIRLTHGITGLRIGLLILHSQVRDEEPLFNDELSNALWPMRAQLAEAVSKAEQIPTFLGLPEIHNEMWTLDESTLPGLGHLASGHRFQSAPSIVFELREAAGATGELPEDLAPLAQRARGPEDDRPPC